MSPPTCANSVDAVEARWRPPRTGVRVAVAGLGAELEEQVGRRKPLELQAVLSALPAEERLVHERLIDEVPGMRVDFVQVAEAREETTALEREAAGSAMRAEVRLFDVDLVLAA